MENSAATNSLVLLTPETIADWLRHRGGGLYGGEAITQLEHALQCAALAQAEDASPALVTAALLHDIGHLADTGNDENHPHATLAAQLLGPLFPSAVTEPIRMHVDAKRYLCATDAAYWQCLSDASRRSLEWQGGPFSRQDASTFFAQPYAVDAVRLRRWDDEAKVPGAMTPALEAFVKIMRTLCA
jgi:phosphonate degradation associated HDIG domain protein